MLPLGICLSVFCLLQTISAKNPHCCFLPSPDNNPGGWAQLNSFYDKVFYHDGYVATTTTGSECLTLWSTVTGTAFCSATAQISAPSYLLPIMREIDGSCPYVAPVHFKNVAPLKQCVAMIMPDPHNPTIFCDPGYTGVCMYQGPGMSDTLPPNSHLGVFYSYIGFMDYNVTYAYPCSESECSITCAHVPGWTSHQVCIFGSTHLTGLYEPYIEMLPQFSGCAEVNPAFPSAFAAIYNFKAGCYQLTGGTNVVNGYCWLGSVQCLYSLNIKEGF